MEKFHFDTRNTVKYKKVIEPKYNYLRHNQQTNKVINKLLEHFNQSC